MKIVNNTVFVGDFESRIGSIKMENCKIFLSRLLSTGGKFEVFIPYSSKMASNIRALVIHSFFSIPLQRIIMAKGKNPNES